jgi:hypothetical protein
MVARIMVACAMTSIVAGLSALNGCAAGKLIGGMAASEEAQKLVEVHAKYELDNKTVAVVVQADYATLFEHPDVVVAVSSGVAMRLARWAPNVQVYNPQGVLNWQQRTPQWNALPYGQIAEQLNVDRVVYVDILEYRLNPPGNRFIWEGEAVARVGIIERDGIDPDAFGDTFDVIARFPTIPEVTREEADEAAIRRGLQETFVKNIAFLFYYHFEPKHPDKYHPELDTKEMRELKAKTGS